MPLEPTNARHRNPASKRGLTRRRLFTGGGALLVAGVLAACTESSSRDAARGKNRDASRESVVKELQATETWNLVNATSTPEGSTPED